MDKSDLMNLSKKYLIVNYDVAGKLHNEKISAIALPAFENELEFKHFALHQDDDALYLQFFDESGAIIRQVKSHYNSDDYVYVREPYFVQDGVVKYYADFCPGNYFIKEKLTPGKYMKKIHSRTFLHIKSVNCIRLSEISKHQLCKLGCSSLFDYSEHYDSGLGENKYEAFKSYNNPYVFYYEFEVLRM